MKIIFLDIDGVLAVNFKDNRDDYGSGFHPEFVTNLKRIIDETGAKIVISSSWRHSGLTSLQEMWKKRELPGEVIDVTVNIKLQRGMISFNREITDHEKVSYGGYSIPRGCEIEYWLKEDGLFTRVNWSKKYQEEILEKSKIKNYVILDDDSDMLFTQKEHYVQCRDNWNQKDSVEGLGLTSVCADQAIKILNSDIVDLYYNTYKK